MLKFQKKFKHIFLALLPNILATFIYSLSLAYSYMLFPWFVEYLHYSIDPQKTLCVWGKNIKENIWTN